MPALHFTTTLNVYLKDEYKYSLTSSKYVEIQRIPVNSCVSLYIKIYHNVSTPPSLVNSLTDLFFNKRPCRSRGSDTDTKPGLCGPGEGASPPPPSRPPISRRIGPLRAHLCTAAHLP